MALTIFYGNIGWNRKHIDHIYRTLKDFLSVTDNNAENDTRKELLSIKSVCLQLSGEAEQLLSSRQNVIRVRLIDGLIDQIGRNFDANEDISKCLSTAGLLESLVLQLRIDLIDLKRRRISFKSKAAMEIEKRGLVDTLINIQEKLDFCSKYFDELDNQLHTNVSDWKWLEQLSWEGSRQFQSYLSANLLFIECLNVSAVSNRPKLMNDNFLK